MNGTKYIDLDIIGRTLYSITHKINTNNFFFLYIVLVKSMKIYTNYPYCTAVYSRYLHDRVNGLHIMAGTHAALMDGTFNLTDAITQACIIPQQTPY